MTSPCLSSVGRAISQLFRSQIGRLFAVVLVAQMVPMAHAFTPAATSTTLTISSSVVPYKTPISLTATVTAAGAPVSTGVVIFCDATAAFCETNSALATVQVTSPQATAAVKLGSGPLGVHSYKALYKPNSSYAGSVSNTVSYTVSGTYASSSTISATGSVGSYTLTGGVVGVGSTTVGPSGDVTFTDTSAGNKVLGTQPLGMSVLSNAFYSAPGSPFAIATSATTVRSVAIASAFLNNDNYLDVVTGDSLQTITVLLGNGDGTFKPKTNYPGCPSGLALKILLADFNRDGYADVALGCSDGTNGSLTILLGKGDGTFLAPTSYTAGDVAGIALGDFNGDGIVDMAVTNHAQKNVMIFTGKGDGTFSAGVIELSTVAVLHDIVVTDFNGDGRDDVIYAVNTAVSNSALSDLYFAAGNGDNTFQTPVLIASEVGEFLTTGDTNGDNKADVISTTITGTTSTNTVGNSLFVLIGNGDGTFKPKVTYSSDIPSDPHLTDVNGDGKPDIIAGGSYGAVVYLGNGDGTFQAYSEPSIGGFSLTYAVNAGDFNNDGNADLIGTDAQSPRAAVSLSEVQQSAVGAALTGVAMLPLGSGTHYVDASYGGDSIYMSSVSATTPLLAAPATTTLVLSAAPSSGTLLGQSVTLMATLSPYSVGPPNTTTDGDTVNFYNGSALLGSGVLNHGIATLATSSLPAGSVPLKAVFPGDSNYLTSTSSTLNVTVTTIILSSTVNPSTYGQTVTLTASVVAGATGTVTFKDGTVVLGTGTISGTTATFTSSTLAIGIHDITGVYSGDTSHVTATSPVLAQEVDKATPTLGLATSGASTYGGAVTITATLPAGPTGTVTFMSGTVTLGTAPVSAGGVATISTSVLPTGTDGITATYSGDTNYNTATGSVQQTVNKIVPTVAVSTSGPSTYGGSVTVTATLPAGATGTVTFTSGTTSLGSGTVSSAGTVSVTTTALPGGTDPITASYGGDTNYTAATGTGSQVVSKASVSSTLTSSLNPSVSGNSVTFTDTLPSTVTGTVTFISGGVTLGTGTVTNGVATVTSTSLPAGSDVVTATYNGDSNYNSSVATVTQTVTKATPTVGVTTTGPSTYGGSVGVTATLPTGTTGTVTFTSGGVTIGSGTVSSTGTVTITTTNLPVGSDPITASYGGDSNNNPASGTVTQTVTKATPTVGVTTTGPSTYGGSVGVTATLPTGTTGTVTFTSGGVTIGSGTVSSTGTVTITTTNLPVGSDPITVSYGGDGNNNPVSGTVTQVVSKLSPTSTLTSSLNPAAPGNSVTFTDTLPVSVTGTVTFTSNGTVIGTGTVVNGVATVTTSTLPGGNDVVTATYNGDTNNNSSVATLTEVVQKLTPTLSVTASGPATYGTPVTITASVPPGTTGTVTFTSGGVTIGSGTVSSTGTVTITTSTLPVGSDPITASYGGDSSNNPVTGTATQVITKVTPPVSLTSSLNPSTVGSPVTFTATVPTGATGTVTFLSGSTVLGTGTIANGVATLTTSTLLAGSQTITASYGGDTNNNAATSAPLTQTVNKHSPVLPAPVVSSNNVTTIDPVTITETVPAGVTGPVSFYSGGSLLGTASIVNGVAVLTVPSLPAGSDLINATTPADANNNAATSPATLVTVTKITPTLGAPTVSSTNPPAGTPVTITETIPPGVTGTITFTSGGTVIGTAPIVNGVATVTVTTLPVGPHPIGVVASSGPTNNPANSPTTLVTVIRATPTVTLSSSANPAAVGQTVLLTASVAVNATGTVTFIDGSTVLGTGVLNSAGVATFTTSSLTIGTHPITASYGGDTNFFNAVSAVLPEVISKAATTVMLSESTPAELLGTTVTFTANVTSTYPATLTGTVTFMDGTTVIGSAPMTTNGGVTVTFAASGNAAFATNTLAAGAHQISAVYSGDTNFAASSAAPVTNTVEDFTNTNSGAASQNVFPGDSTSYTFTLAPVGAKTFLDDVSLTITGLPTGSTYTFSPATVAAGGGSATVTLTVKTSSTLSAQNRAPRGGSESNGRGTIALGMLGLAGLEAIRRRRRQMPRMLLMVLLAAASLLPIAAMSGCAGGGYFALTPTTYSITVTGSESSIQHAATASLIVQ